MLTLTLGNWFYIHGLETMLIISVIFTGIGFFFGYLMWRHYQQHVHRIQNTNTKLRDKITILEAHQKKSSSSHEEPSLDSESPTS